ncbi:MAG: glycosyltransferase, partial [Cyclobacteriaceae bacterium]|nr:glycosyltransferase [Cyclobacteriaceae bacterium]
MIVVYVAWVVYLLFVFGLIVVWTSSKVPRKKSASKLDFSIIIPIRDEEENITLLLDDLNKQTYSFQNFEVIIVNDHSTDRSKQIVLKTACQLSCSLKIIDLEEGEEGKKAAITAGIRASKFDTIITTDGDCRLHEGWVNKINNVYDDGVVLVFGAVQYEPIKSIFHRLQALELSALMATGAMTHFFGLHGMCNGANFSFSK